LGCPSIMISTLLSDEDPWGLTAVNRKFHSVRPPILSPVSSNDCPELDCREKIVYLSIIKDANMTFICLDMKIPGFTLSISSHYQSTHRSTHSSKLIAPSCLIFLIIYPRRRVLAWELYPTAVGQIASTNSFGPIRRVQFGDGSPVFGKSSSGHCFGLPASNSSDTSGMNVLPFAFTGGDQSRKWEYHC